MNGGTIEDRVVLIRIPRLYRDGMSELELYEATRGFWKVGIRRERAEYALAIANGIVLEVYEIVGWQPAETDSYQTRPADEFRAGRWEFVGKRAPHGIRSKYLYREVKEHFRRGNQNPIRYLNC